MRRTTITLLAASLCLAVTATANSAEIRLTLVSSWSKRQNFAIEFQNYLDAVNEAGRGIVQIDYLGGPEVIPEQQQLYALRRGVIDMEFGGVTYYRGLLPEGDAIFGSTLTLSNVVRREPARELETEPVRAPESPCRQRPAHPPPSSSDSPR